MRPSLAPRERRERYRDLDPVKVAKVVQLAFRGGPRICECFARPRPGAERMAALKRNAW
jgi:hypothetical protein